METTGDNRSDVIKQQQVQKSSKLLCYAESKQCKYKHVQTEQMGMCETNCEVLQLTVINDNNDISDELYNWKQMFMSGNE